MVDPFAFGTSPKCELRNLHNNRPHSCHIWGNYRVLRESGELRRELTLLSTNFGHTYLETNSKVSISDVNTLSGTISLIFAL